MRFHSIAVRNFRGIAAQRLEPLPVGVTIVAGPNEAGKTTLTDAVDFLFERHNTSQAAEIRQAQPLGRDVGPEVEVEGEAGPYRFRYRKRFVKQPETELEITAPRGESHTGRDAHDRMRALLGEVGVDLGLWRALRVVQGGGVGQPVELANSPSLMSALDRAAVGKGTAQRQSGALYDRARVEHLRYFTEKRGDARVGGPLEEARSELAAAREVEAALSADLVALERNANLAEELQERRAVLREEVERSEASLEESSAALEQVEGVEEQIRNLHSRVVEEESIRDLLQEVQEARKAEEEVAALLKSAESDARRAEMDLAPSEATLAAAQGERERAEEELETARVRLQLAEQLHSCRGALEELEERIERAAAAAQRVEDAETTLSSLPAVDETAVQELEDLVREGEKVAAALAAASPKIAVAPLADLTVQVSTQGGDRELELSRRDIWEDRPSSPLRLTLPGVAEITVTPGGDVEELAARQKAVEMESRSRLEVLGVEDVESAAGALRDRRQAEVALESARAVLREATTGADLETLTARHETTAADTARLADELLQMVSASGEDIPPTPELARQTLTATQRDARLAREREEETRRAVGEKRHVLEAARGTMRELRVEHRTAVERRRRAQRRLSALDIRRDEGASAAECDQIGLFADSGEVVGEGDGVGDEGEHEKKGGEFPSVALETALATAESRVEAVRQEMTEARRRLARHDPETVRRHAAEAAETHRRLVRQLRQVEDEHLQVSTRLDTAGQQGLFEQVQEARARLAAAERRAATIEARAAAARRLFEALSAARETARQAISEPLRRTVEDLGRPLFGDDFTVELGEDLTIVRRTASGRTLEVERLSTGAREQLSLLLRLACALLVTSSEGDPCGGSDDSGVPLILDDALGYSDPGRLAALGEVLSLAGERCQVIVLTSFPQRYRGVRDAFRVELTAGDGRTPAVRDDSPET